MDCWLAYVPCLFFFRAFTLYSICGLRHTWILPQFTFLRYLRYWLLLGSLPSYRCMAPLPLCLAVLRCRLGLRSLQVHLHPDYLRLYIMIAVWTLTTYGSRLHGAGSFITGYRDILLPCLRSDAPQHTSRIRSVNLAATLTDSQVGLWIPRYRALPAGHAPRAQAAPVGCLPALRGLRVRWLTAVARYAAVVCWTCHSTAQHTPLQLPVVSAHHASTITPTRASGLPVTPRCPDWTRLRCVRQHTTARLQFTSCGVNLCPCNGCGTFTAVVDGCLTLFI